MSQERERRLLAKKLMKQPVTKFKEVDLKTVSFIPFGMTRAFKNTRYMVMVFDNRKVSTGFAIQVLIQKHDDTPILNHWSEIQKIKNEIFGNEITAIEYFPPESKLVNQYNIYWIWIFPDGVLPTPM